MCKIHMTTTKGFNEEFSLITKEEWAAGVLIDGRQYFAVPFNRME